MKLFTLAVCAILAGCAHSLIVVNAGVATETLAPNNCKMTNLFTCAINKFHPTSIA